MTQTHANVLVVDDTVANLKLMLAVLSEAGFHVNPIQDSRLVMRQARMSPPDLILLDIDMPNYDGFDICQMLKADPQLKDIPIIIMSATGVPLDTNRARSVGAVAYIEKPIKLDDVVRQVREHIVKKTE